MCVSSSLLTVQQRQHISPLETMVTQSVCSSNQAFFPRAALVCVPVHGK